MTSASIDTYLTKVQDRIDQHGLYGYSDKWFRLRNNLRKERKRAAGRDDSMAGHVCVSNDGCYLEGYHDPRNDSLYYVTWDQLWELRRNRPEKS